MIWHLKRGFVAAVLLSLSMSVLATTKNGFPLGDASIPAEQIFQGGPPRDGIPSIDNPSFVPAKQADFLAADDRILGVHLNGVARAYPINILNWHEVVNDEIAGEPVVITFCPLCGTGMAFEADNAGQALVFGVSGLLYQSDVLLYDRNTESLWSQVMREAVSGPFKGRKLTQLPLEHTSWQDWRRRYPNSEVLGLDTGFSRDYNYTPYGNYEHSKRLYFEVNHTAPKRYHPKEQVLGVTYLGKTKAYPFKELSEQGLARFTDQFSDEQVTVHWNESARSARILDSKNEVIVSTTAFWFAWYTFHPNTEVFKAPR